ncbi:MAG TPA: signal peptidase I [Chloroflexi bacterium]|nr:signal peptidase I [Chloroflexota bacterium]
MIPDPLPLSVGEASWRQILIDIFETLVISLVLFAIINTASARIRVESVSMKDTLNPGDFVVVNRLAYKWNDVGRGDVVIFDPPFDSPEPFVKRVIGLPGEQVLIQDGKIYVNDVLVQEPYLDVDFHTNGVWEVPMDSIFVMGDNRNNSSDSRSWGTVPVENIIGKALFIYWPVNQWGTLASGAVAAENP